MSPSEYLRRAGRINFKVGIGWRSNSWGKRALAHLNRDADAEPLVWAKKVVAVRVGPRLVCMKQRYQTEADAMGKVAQIAREPDGRVKPIRAYACCTCLGWHITSQELDAD